VIYFWRGSATSSRGYNGAWQKSSEVKYKIRSTSFGLNKVSTHCDLFKTQKSWKTVSITSVCEINDLTINFELQIMSTSCILYTCAQPWPWYLYATVVYVGLVPCGRAPCLSVEAIRTRWPCTQAHKSVHSRRVCQLQQFWHGRRVFSPTNVYTAAVCLLTIVCVVTWVEAWSSYHLCLRFVSERIWCMVSDRH